MPWKSEPVSKRRLPSVSFKLVDLRLPGAAESEADIVEFRAREIVAGLLPPATSTLPLGSNVAV